MRSDGLVTELGPTSWVRVALGTVAAVALVGVAPEVGGLGAPGLRALVLGGSAIAAVTGIASVSRSRLASASLHLGAWTTVVLVAATMTMAHAVAVGVGTGGSAATLASQWTMPLAMVAVLVERIRRLAIERHDPSIATWATIAQSLPIGAAAVATSLAALALVFGGEHVAATSPGLAAVISIGAIAATAFPASTVADGAARTDRPAAMAVALGVSVMAASSAGAAAAVGTDELAAWVPDLAASLGLLAATAGVRTMLTTTTAASEFLAPLDRVAPGRAVELENDPVVTRHLAELDRVDAAGFEHVRRVTALAIGVAAELRLAPADIRTVAVGALLHDVGKRDADRALLASGRPLSRPEYADVMAHTSRGAAALAASPVLADAAIVVAAHHAPLAGPAGLPPIGARIVAACDAFDAMAASPRFRGGRTRADLLTIMREQGRAQWDAEVVAALSRVVRRTPEIPAASGSGARPVPVAADGIDDRSTSKACCCPDAIPGAIAVDGTSAGARGANTAG